MCNFDNINAKEENESKTSETHRKEKIYNNINAIDNN
jgi:hypothetical protein